MATKATPITATKQSLSKGDRYALAIVKQSK